MFSAEAGDSWISREPVPPGTVTAGSVAGSVTVGLVSLMRERPSVDTTGSGSSAGWEGSAQRPRVELKIPASRIPATRSTATVPP